MKLLPSRILQRTCKKILQRSPIFSYFDHPPCRDFTTEAKATEAKATEPPPLLQSLDSDGVLTLTINRPKQRNALNRELLESLHDALKRAATAASTVPSSNNGSPVRVVIMQSHGTVFSSGHDLKEILGLSQHKDARRLKELFEICTETMQLFQSMPQPTICAVEGLATAAGCQLVASCDMVVASSLASFQTPGVSLGLFCHTPAVPLARCIGSKLAMDMLLTGRELSANEALAHGLVSRMAKDAHKAAAKIAKTLATDRSAAAVRLGKATFYQQLDSSDIQSAYDIATEAMVKNMELYDAKHGIDSFLEKKYPSFQHK